ncbi:MAG: hypothetical protein CMI03_06535 [Oceanospirillaceae bacterium]|nr:hypothetical protein [Thalassolituus sp.]MBS52389.1 hypothetical protein [Oceanospirillaceae bacterium]|tara:strand:- start:1249 stop:1770 length:522 start_codon:yes stop_codon:yes gene_type:complete
MDQWFSESCVKIPATEYKEKDMVPSAALEFPNGSRSIIFSLSASLSRVTGKQYQQGKYLDDPSVLEVVYDALDCEDPVVSQWLNKLINLLTPHHYLHLAEKGVSVHPEFPATRTYRGSSIPLEEAGRVPEQPSVRVYRGQQVTEDNGTASAKPSDGKGKKRKVIYRGQEVWVD